MATAAAVQQIGIETYACLLPSAIHSLPECLGALDYYEDCILFAAGVYGLVMSVRNWRVIGRRFRDEQEPVI